MSSTIVIHCKFCGSQLSIPHCFVKKGRCSKCKETMDVPKKYRYNFWLSKCAIYLSILYIFIAISTRLTDSSGGWFPYLLSTLVTFPGSFILDLLGYEVEYVFVFTLAMFITTFFVFFLGSCLEYFFRKITVMLTKK